MKKDDKIRFRVLAETFRDIPPVQKETLLARKTALESGDLSVLSVSSTKSPYLLTVANPYLIKLLTVISRFQLPKMVSVFLIGGIINKFIELYLKFAID
jgi:hypothetical protein